MKLYTDADITTELARVLRRLGYDAISAAEAGNAEASDAEQLAFAATERRALLTCNIRHFARLYETYWNEGRDHSGIVVSQQLEFGEMLRRVRLLMDSVPEQELRNRWPNLAEFASPDRRLRERDAAYGAPVGLR